MIHSPKLFPKHVLQSYQAEYQGNDSLSPFKKQLLCVWGGGAGNDCVLHCSVLRHTEIWIQLSSAWHFWGQVLSTRMFLLTILAAVPACRKKRARFKRQDSKGQRKMGMREAVPVTKTWVHFLFGQKWWILVCSSYYSVTLSCLIKYFHMQMAEVCNVLYNRAVLYRNDLEF